jgi:LacI family transcriptional regulator
MAVGHLAGLGHRRIAYIAGPQELSTGLSRYRGFVTAMESSGLPVDNDLVVFAKSFTVEEGMRCSRLLLERGAGGAPGAPEAPGAPGAPGCTAIAAGNDMLAVGCYAALDETGLSCPEDISVVGFNDMPFIDRLRPPLTTVRFPHYQVGTEAAQLLLERIAEHAGPVKILYLAPELVVRGSTARARVSG